MKSLRIEIEEALHNDLKMKAIQDGLTVSELVRNKIEEIIVGDTPQENSTPEVVQESQENKIDTEAILKVKEALDEAESKPSYQAKLKEAIGMRTCKNGHIVNSYTQRCTQKDCKYS